MGMVGVVNVWFEMGRSLVMERESGFEGREGEEGLLSSCLVGCSGCICCCHVECRCCHVAWKFN